MRPETVDKNLLLRLLTENELNHREIADRLGCTAERVRQLELELLGRTGHEAQRERRERRLRERFESKEFVRAGKRKGLNIKPVIGGSGQWYETELYVNGRLCLLRRAYENVGYKNWYVSIRKPLKARQRAETCILELGNGKFLIIPMKEMPTSPTMFRASLKGVYTLKRSWRKYLNRWSVLRKSPRQR
jgi:hypothetical protein